MSILRLLFIVLLLLNLLALAANQGYFGTAAPAGEPERLTNQLHPERIALDGERPPAAPPAQPAPPAPPAQPAPSQPAPAPAAPAGALPVAQAACVSLGGLGGEAADTLARSFDGPLFEVRRDSTTTTSSWWVRIPPDGTREYADRKGRELRALGVTDFFITQEAGPTQYSVSLGLFKSEAAANQHLANLRRAGVRSAGITSRSITTHSLQIRGPQSEIDTRLASAALPAGTTPQPCTEP